MIKSNIQVITAPEQLPSQNTTHTIFLAGGITGCPDWQGEAIRLFQKRTIQQTILFNPRRPNFPIHDPSAAGEQIEWEFKALKQADTIIFWFCKETIQPITLYELGRHAYRFSMGHLANLFVGVEPGYPREQDVRIQLELACGRCPTNSLERLVYYACTK